MTGSGTVHYEPLEATKIPSTNWHTVALHIQGPYPTNDYSIALIDCRSRYPVVVRVQRVTAKTVIKALDVIFSMFGYARKLVADNGKQLISDKFKNYLQQNGIKLRNVTPYSPRVNGAKQISKESKSSSEC